MFSTNQFVDGFIQESTELLNSVNSCIIDLTNLTRKTVEYESILKEVLRMLHTIKGSARMLDFSTVEKLCHSLEEIIKNTSSKKTELNDITCALILKTTEEISKCFSNIAETGNESAPEDYIERLTKTCKKAAAGQYFSLDEFEDYSDFSQQDSDENQDLLLNSGSTIRTDIKSINSILRSFDNMIITQIRLRQEIKELEKQLIEGKGAKIKSLPKQLKDDLLYNEDEIINTQHKILELRMLPINIILPSLKKEIETESLKLNKKVKLDIPSSNIMLDKIILEQLKNIIIQIIRNSIVHGIETRQERKKNGKNPEGVIKITLNQISNRLIITISDDGRGIQYEAIRERAMEMFPAKEELKNASESELQEYIFLSGFSTQKNCDTLSGRGIGLDIVKNSIEKIHGKIHVKSKQGQGTVFELNIPISIGTQQGLFINAGGMKFIIPSHYILEIFDKDEAHILSIQGQNYVSGHEQLIPIYYLSSILNTGKSSDIKSIIIVEYFDSKLAIAVDGIYQYESVIVNPLPQILRQMDSLQGLVYDEDYSIIPLLNVPFILQKLKNQQSYDLKKYETFNTKKTFSILVVDDSDTTVQIEKSIFENDGYTVHTAHDGIEAMEKLKTVHIDAVISDVNMPRMDGIILLNNIRHTPEYNKIPVIILTGAYEADSKRFFTDKGAQAFFVKSNFERDELLKAVKENLNE